MSERTVVAFDAPLPSPPAASAAALSGRDGELVLLRITVPPRLLEPLLETLAETPYHINPQVLGASTSGGGGGGNWAIEFPAYNGWLDPVRAALRQAGLEAAAVVETTAMLTAIGN